MTAKAAVTEATLVTVTRFENRFNAHLFDALLANSLGEPA